MNFRFASSFLFLLFALATACSDGTSNDRIVQCIGAGASLPSTRTTLPLAVGAALSATPAIVTESDEVEADLSFQITGDAVTMESWGQEPATFRAVREGVAEIVVLRDLHDEIARFSLEVRTPDRFELFSRREVLAGATADEARVAVPRIVVGERADFFLRAFAGDQELAIGVGHISFGADGTLTRTPAGAASVSLEASHLGEESVPVHFQSSFFGEAADSVLSLPVRGVLEDSVTSLAFVGPDVAEAQDEDCVTATSVPRDADGEVVEGARVVFTARRSGDVLGAGAVLNYPHRAHEALEVEASLGLARASATLTTDPRAVQASGTSSCSAFGARDVSLFTTLLFVLSVFVSKRVRHALRRA